MRQLLKAETGMSVLKSLKEEGEARFGGRWALDGAGWDEGRRCTAEWDEDISM
jgi:hypothetical protein